MTRQETIALLAWDAAVISHRIHQSHCERFGDKERARSYDLSNACGVIALKALYDVSQDLAHGQVFSMPLLVAEGR